jgi:hypothetical protein
MTPCAQCPKGGRGERIAHDYRSLYRLLAERISAVALAQCNPGGGALKSETNSAERSPLTEGLPARLSLAQCY